MAGLTVQQIERAKPGAVRREIADSYCTGLYHILQPSGFRSWAVRYRADGKSRKLTLPVAPLDLAGARKAAAVALRAVAEGKDPALEKRLDREMPKGRDDLANVASSFVSKYVEKHTRASSQKETQRIFKAIILPKFGRRRIQDITRRDVIDLLDVVAERAPVMANRTLAALRRFFNWCIETDKLSASPCAGVKPPGNETKRDRVLTDDELRMIWTACEADNSPFSKIVQLLILTAQRRDEVAEMRWSEVDLERRLWTIPRERVKNDTAHEVPLSDRACEIIGSLPRISGEFVFTTTGQTPVSGFSRFKERLDKALPVSARWTLHDLRRTTATGMARIGIALPVVEKLLNHTGGSFSGVAGIYQRHSFAAEKAQAVQAWARHLDAVLSGSSNDSNIIPLRG